MSSQNKGPRVFKTPLIKHVAKGKKNLKEHILYITKCFFFVDLSMFHNIELKQSLQQYEKWERKKISLEQDLM